MFKSLLINKIILYVIVLGVLFRCYYNVYLYWCFNGFMGSVFKINFFNIDLFIFILFSLFLNFYWYSEIARHIVVM